MATIEIRVDDKVLDKLLWVLSRFKESEVQVIRNSVEFSKLKKQVQSDYTNAVEEGAKTYSLKDIENDLEDILAQYGA